MKQRMAVLSLVLALVLLVAGLPGVSAAPGATAPAGASSLGNYVWLDANANGWHDQAGDGPEAEFGAAGINGVKVNLYLDANKNGVIDPGEFQATTTTGDDLSTPAVEKGWYLFPGITANGNQFIVEVDPSNFAVGGPLAGMVLTSSTTYGPEPLVVLLNQISVDYKEADFGYIASPLRIDKALLNTSSYAPIGTSVTFRITITNASGTLTVNPVPLDDFYSPACLAFVSATIAPNTIDAVDGWLHWVNVGPLGPGASVVIDVTFTSQLTQQMAWKEGGWQDYAPKGIPDFDERQAGWDNPAGSGAGWYQDGPVAMANSLWWFDSKFEPGTLPPPNISDGYPLIKSYNTFTPTVVWDDHDARNVPPLVAAINPLMGTTPGAGTTPTGVANGTVQFIANSGLAASYTVTTQAKPTFQWVGDEVRASEDVVLLLGFWQEGLDGAASVRVGGHYVTSSGIDLANSTIGLSDPMRNAAEGASPASGAGRVLPGMHSASHPSPVGVAGDTVHNDAQYLSQDVYPSGQLSGAITAGNWGLQGYVAPNPGTGCTQVAPFQGKNVPSEFSGQQGACSPNGGALWTVVEYAVAVSPKTNTLLCSPTTNIAAVTDAKLENSQWTLPPVQDEERITEGMDLGDLADTPYPTLIATNGARHLITSPLMLGFKIDSELDGQPGVSANGDDLNGLIPDDEDGVTPVGLWKDGTVASGNGGILSIQISGLPGVPQVFIDFGSGLNPVILRDNLGNPLAAGPLAPGSHLVHFDVPAGTMAPGPTLPTRVRLSSAGGLGATGLALDGEVEDYLLQFAPNAVSVAQITATPALNLGLVLALVALLVGGAWVWRRRLA